MLKRLIACGVLCILITCILVACGVDTGSNASGPQVHMNATNFVQTSITIHKGQSLDLVDDSSVPHVITNGTWADGTAKPVREAGAPEIKDLQVGGYSLATIGPFTKAGTFKLYCPIHSGMNLTVIVQ